MYRCAKTVLSEASALYKTQFVKADLIGADSLSALQRLDQPWLGPCDNIAPDLAMYLSIDTQQRFGGTDLCFIARIGGAIGGAAGVAGVLRTLVRSRTTNASWEQQCTGRAATSAVQMLNIKPSYWARDRFVKPVAKHAYTYILVKDHPC